MKKFWIAMTLVFALVLSGCGSNNTNITPDPINDTTPEVIAPISPTDSTPVADQISNVNESNSPQSVSTTVNETYKDFWAITTYINHVPFRPSNYNGLVTDYSLCNITKDGIVAEVTYRDIPFVLEDDTSYDEEYGEYKSYRFIKEIDGNTLTGQTFWSTERFDFLEHYHDDTVDRFLLDIVLPSDIEAVYDLYQFGIFILKQNDNKVLMTAGCYLFTYNFETGKTNLISDTMLTFNHLGDEFLFTNWDHIEYELDWAHDDTLTETGNKVFSYRDESFSLEPTDVLGKEFFSIQSALRNGETTKEAYADQYIIYSNGLTYAASDRKYLFNIHMPNAYSYNGNLMHGDSLSSWLIDGSKLNLCHFGEVISYDLFDGNWRIIQSNIMLSDQYVANADNNGKCSIEEFESSITSLNILLMNVDEQTIYIMGKDGELHELFNDVMDYYEREGVLYWIDSNDNAYACDWANSKNQMLIGENAIGFAPRINEVSPKCLFLVDPTTTEDYTLYHGFPFAIEWPEFE